MTNIRFGNSGYPAPGSTYNFLYNQAVRTFERPDRLSQIADTIIQSSQKSGTLEKMVAYTKAGMIRFASLWTNYDYSKFSPVSLGKLKFNVTDPPKGALLLLLYPLTVGPRMYRAIQRAQNNSKDNDPNNNNYRKTGVIATLSAFVKSIVNGDKDTDYREVWDVLRRDMLSITFFVFALDPVKRMMGQATSNFKNMNLMNPDKSDVLTYSQLRNFRVDSPEALRAIIAEGNGPALLEAVNKLDDRGLAKATGDGQLGEKYKRLQENVKTLVENAQHQMANKKTNWHNDVQHVFQAFQNIDNQRKELLERAMQASPEVLHATKEIAGEAASALEKHAKTWRLPSDMISFAMVMGLIGWFPVKFNSLWNSYQFHREEEAIRRKSEEQQQQSGGQGFPPQAPLNSRVTFQSLRYSSRLAPSARPFEFNG
jgi:hypothetical protein